MQKLLDKYIIKKFVSILFLIITSFIIIFLIVNIIDFLDKFIEHKLTSKEILLYYIYTTPLFFSIALPMSILISTIFTFSSLQKNNEITAIKASGISIRRTGMPILIIGVLLCIFSFYFDNTVVTKAINKRADIEKKFKPSKSKYAKTRKSDIYYSLKNSILEIKRFNYRNDTGHEISLQKYFGQDITYRFDAKKMIWDEKNKLWKFYNCNIREWQNNDYKYSFISDTSFAIIDIFPEIIKKDTVKPEEMDYWELSLFISKLKDKGLDYTRWLVNKHYKIAFACIPFIMVVFGLGLSISKPRSNHAIGFGLSIIVIFLYYALILFGRTLGYNNVLPPFLSVWIINFLFLSTGLYIFIRART